MLKVSFYNNIDDSLLKFAVIVSTAKRELYEETGAMEYSIKKICVYSVCGNDGMIENI